MSNAKFKTFSKQEKLKEFEADLFEISSLGNLHNVLSKQTIFNRDLTPLLDQSNKEHLVLN